MTDLTGIIDTLTDLIEDDTMPRNVKAKVVEIQELLKSDAELSVKINTALNDLDEISQDANLQSFTRTQLWNISSLLESL